MSAGDWVWYAANVPFEVAESELAVAITTAAIEKKTLRILAPGMMSIMFG
jgi:hypothetical protein